MDKARTITWESVADWFAKNEQALLDIAKFEGFKGVVVEVLRRAPPQLETIPKFKFDTLVQHCKRLEKDLAQARAEVNEVTLYQENAVWFWQHDGEDYLDSLSCPIIIQPHHLRELLFGPTQKQLQMERLLCEMRSLPQKRCAAFIADIIDILDKPKVDV